MTRKRGVDKKHWIDRCCSTSSMPDIYASDIFMWHTSCLCKVSPYGNCCLNGQKNSAVKSSGPVIKGSQVNDIEALIEGFKAFKNESEQSGQGKYRNLAEYGPHPKILMVACCDSRVDPAIITNSSAGDLMVIRNIANLVPPYHPDSSFKETQAAIEFAVCYRHVEHIIVMVHSRCAGIRSLLTRLLDFGIRSRRAVLLG